MEYLLNLISSANDVLWTYIVVTMLVACALFFTWRLRGMQFRMWGEMWHLLVSSTSSRKPTEIPSAGEGGKQKKTINSFQAFAVSLSSRVGTGNLAGVASAIFVGGPGAVFWMWVMALLGSATAFIEATLAQLYKRKGEDAFYGGPAYYMTFGLHRRWMGVLFAVLITLTFGFANQVVQSNTLCDALADAFVLNKAWVGAFLAVMTLLIVFGGIQRISKFSAVVVPFMAVGYIILSIYIILTNITAIPAVITTIVKSAFGVQQAAGGMIGAAIMQGVKRGLFSNEAGEGSAPNAAATASISHPVKQGLLQALGVFTDTLVICTCTAFIILISGLYDGQLDGILLTSAAITSELGKAGHWFLSLAIFLFAYSTIIANYFYGENNIRFITGKRWPIQVFRVITGGVVLVGGLVTLQTAWSFVDLAMGLMTIVNLVAIVWLSPKAVKLFHNYIEQRKAGKDPEFDRSMMPDIADDLDAWE